MKITATIITFNEESNIADAIRSVSWADEIVVVDSESTDRTRQIAGEMGAKVLVNSWPGFSAQKQFAVDRASHDWIFSLDADERVSDELAAEIKELRRAGTSTDGYRIPRLSFYGNRPVRHGGWYPDHQLRLFDRRKAKWNGAVIHESVEMSAGATVEKLTGDILHYTIGGPDEHERMINERYAPLGAQKMYDDGRTTSRSKAAASSAFAFVRAYFLKLGFLDGVPGYHIAYFAARHAYLKHMLLMSIRREKDRPN